jgi:hypothetical protein
VGTNLDYSIRSARSCAAKETSVFEILALRPSPSLTLRLDRCGLFPNFDRDAKLRKHASHRPIFSTIAKQLSGRGWVGVGWRRDFMSWNKVLLSALLGIMLAGAFSRGRGQVVMPRRPVASGPAAKAPKQEPCWEVAGVSKAAMQQRRAITQRARQEVEGVCANSALSAQQKQQEIKEIRLKERQEMEATISPEQQEALRSCQQERNHGGHGGGHVGGGGHGGPCGEMAVGQKPHPTDPHPMEEDETPANDAAKPN